MSVFEFKNAAAVEFNTKVSRLSNTGKPQEDFLYANMQEWLESKQRKLMLKAQDYYVNDSDILERKRYYIDRMGIKQEVTNLSNSKLNHPTMRKLVNQKVNYLLSKEMSIQSDSDGLSKALTQFIDRKFLNMAKNLGKDAIVNGLAWLQVYYNEMGKLKFKRIPTEEIIPFWADADHTILDAILRVYQITQYLPEGGKKVVTKLEYHTPEGVWYYEKGTKGLKPDPDKGQNPAGHFKTVDVNVDEDGNAIERNIESVWDKVPFIAFKYNSDEISLLKLVKALLDDYDINTSDTSNNLQDVPNSIKVVRNYDGADKPEFVQNLAVFRTAFVSGDGDVTSLDTKLDTQAIDSHLNRLRKDIYEAGSGVDTQEVSLGNASGVALKFRFADLDSDTDDIASEFAVALEEVIWFIKVDLFNRGLGDFFEDEVEIIFNTDSILNEAEIITSAKESAGIISDETIVANHPWVTDTAEELARIKLEREAKMKEMEDAFGGELDNNFGSQPSEGGDE